MPGQAVLSGAPLITTNAPPVMGQINSYSAVAGSITVTLPALSATNPGANCLLEKILTDQSQNTVTFLCAGTDSFDDGNTSHTLYTSGDQVALQAVQIAGVAYWKIRNRNFLRRALEANSIQIGVTNTTALSAPAFIFFPATDLYPGATFRTILDGTVQVKATSGTLTFFPTTGDAFAYQQAQMPSQGSAAGPVGFHLECITTFRTTGSLGTFIVKPFGVINFATPVYLTSTSTLTNTTNTTGSGTGGQGIAMYVQWQTADPANSLLVETATIERLA